jgi:hypothetical protein
MGSLDLAVLVEKSGGKPVRSTTLGGVGACGGAGWGACGPPVAPEICARSTARSLSGVTGGPSGKIRGGEPEGWSSLGVAVAGLAGGLRRGVVGAARERPGVSASGERPGVSSEGGTDEGGRVGWLVGPGGSGCSECVEDIVVAVGEVITTEGRALVQMYFMISGMGSSGSSSETSSLQQRSSRNSFLITLYFWARALDISVLRMMSCSTSILDTSEPGGIKGSTGWELTMSSRGKTSGAELDGPTPTLATGSFVGRGLGYGPLLAIDGG